MASAVILNDFESTGSSPGLIVDSSGISVAQVEEKYKDVIRCGFLWKKNAGMSTGRVSSRARFYVLTRAALDYYRNDKCDKLKGSYPLATIASVTSADDSGSTIKITFPETVPVYLQAGDTFNCQEWINAIQEGICKWSMNDSEVTTENVIDVEQAMKFPSQSVLRKSTSEALEETASLSGEFAMIKYSRAGTASIPHERVFKLDHENLQIMWRKARKGYAYKSTLDFAKIVEVRCGQQTRNFNQFPYLEVEKQSFSLMFEREQGEWSSLMSLDLICDSILASQSWKRGLKALIYGDDNHAPLRNLQEPRDPIILHDLLAGVNDVLEAYGYSEAPDNNILQLLHGNKDLPKDARNQIIEFADYLKRVWATMEHKGQISYEDAVGFIQNLAPDTNKRNLKNFIRNIARTQRGTLKSSGFLNWDCFLILFDSFVNQLEVHEIYKKYLKTFPDLGLTPQEFMNFLEEEQKESNITLKTCVDLIDYHDKPHYFYKRICARGDPSAFQNSRRLLSYHGFVSFLRSKDNSAFDFNHMKTHQDMDHPLSDYFINSSHNTYLTAHQLKGLSSCEAYVRVLQQGCRCVEIDCWDGPDEPIVTHGLTLTTKIKFRDVIQIIKEYAFEKNPYPVVLSLENHCSEEQQATMANMFVAEFGDLLATEDLSENNILPSPNKLLRKIILKGRAVPKKKSKPFKGAGGRQTSVSNPQGIRSWSQISIQSNFSTTSTTKLQTAQSSDTINAGNSEDTMSLNAEDLVQVPLAGSMSRLIVYCRAVPFKRSEFSEHCCEMHSLSENAAMDLIERAPQDLFYISRKKLLRTYPKGSRVESSNFNPMPMWKAGIHMASVNFQKPDSGMHINQGFFRTNGGCGYVLKPAHLRRNLGVDFSNLPDAKTAKQMVLKIKVLSGHFVDTDIIGQSPVSLEIETVGSEARNSCFTTEVHSNYCNPQWKEGEYSTVISNPELCVLYFKLYSVSRTSRMVLQTAIPVNSLKQGLRYVPMKTLTGVDVNQNGVFVSVGIETADQHAPLRQTSSKGLNSKPRRRITTF